MTILYGNDTFAILVLSTKKKVLQYFEKGFRFPENLFKVSELFKISNDCHIWKMPITVF